MARSMHACGHWCINYSVTENLFRPRDLQREHTNSILSLSRGRYTGSLLFVSGGNIGAAWNGHLVSLRAGGAAQA